MQPLHSFLRVHPEPCVHVLERDVHDGLVADPAGYVAFLRARLEAIAGGEASVELPPKQIFTDEQGDFRVMPCVLQMGGERHKTVKLVGTNLAQQTVPDQVTVGRAFRLHPVENYITHVYEACLLSSARTGACIALATDLLAVGRGCIAIVGAGRVGYYSARFLSTLEDVSAFVCCDRDPERARTLASVVETETGVPSRAGPETSLRDADVVVLATTSERPVLAASEVDAALVVSAGADTETQRELDASWPGVADVYVDSTDGVQVGDLRAWIAAGVMEEADVIDLLRLVADGPTDSRGGRRVFISTGSALFDNLTIEYLLRRETSQGERAGADAQ